VASAKLDVREAPFFDELLKKGKKLWKKVIGYRCTKRNLMWELARLVVQADEHEGGSKYGKEWIKTYAKDVGVHYNWLYDAMQWYRIDSADRVEETEVSTFVENIAFSRIRKIIGVVQSHDELKDLLSAHPDLDVLPVNAFERVLDQRRKMKGDIPGESDDPPKEETTPKEYTEPDDDEEKDKTEPPEVDLQEDPPEPRERLRDTGEYPTELDDSWASLKMDEPELADKVILAGDGESFSITMEYLNDLDECRIICKYFVDALNGLEGE
jgi:hypothetical protein